MNQGDEGEKSWRLKQIIGGDNREEMTEDDQITTIEFSPWGDYMAIGDNAGRIIVFEKGKGSEEYVFLTELQAHSKFFDYFRSMYIAPRINSLQWIRPLGKSHLFLTATEKSINLCRSTEKLGKVYEPVNTDCSDVAGLIMPKAKVDEQATWHSSVIRHYPKLHSHIINSVSLCANHSEFLSADELNVYMWNIETAIKAYPILEFRSIEEDAPEVITAAKFSPVEEHVYLISTTKCAHLADTRKPTHNLKKTLRFEEPVLKRNVFTEYLNAVNSSTFAEPGKIITREPLQTKVWDIRVTNKPLTVIPLYDGLKHKLAEMVENDYIFDRFNVVSSPCGKRHATGLYQNTFHILDNTGNTNLQVMMSWKKATRVRTIPKGPPEAVPDNWDFELKTLRLAWHTTENIIAVPNEGAIFVYKLE